MRPARAGQLQLFKIANLSPTFQPTPPLQKKNFNCKFISASCTLTYLPHPRPPSPFPQSFSHHTLFIRLLWSGCPPSSNPSISFSFISHLLSGAPGPCFPFSLFFFFFCLSCLELDLVRKLLKAHLTCCPWAKIRVHSIPPPLAISSRGSQHFLGAALLWGESHRSVKEEGNCPRPDTTAQKEWERRRLCSGGGGQGRKGPPLQSRAEGLPSRQRRQCD